jgi:hypothetical protein
MGSGDRYTGSVENCESWRVPRPTIGGQQVSLDEVARPPTGEVVPIHGAPCNQLRNPTRLNCRLPAGRPATPWNSIGDLKCPNSTRGIPLDAGFESGGQEVRGRGLTGLATTNSHRSSHPARADHMHASSLAWAYVPPCLELDAASRLGSSPLVFTLVEGLIEITDKAVPSRKVGGAWRSSSRATPQAQTATSPRVATVPERWLFTLRAGRRWTVGWASQSRTQVSRGGSGRHGGLAPRRGGG